MFNNNYYNNQRQLYRLIQTDSSRKVWYLCNFLLYNYCGPVSPVQYSFLNRDHIDYIVFKFESSVFTPAENYA